MASAVEICNLALSNIRGGSISSLDQSSLQAQTCNLKYPFIRDMMLSETAWGFNRAIETLAVSSTEIFNWAYAYHYPNDCLKINRLIGAQEELANSDADVISRLIDSQILPISNLRNKIPHEIFNFDNEKLIGVNESDLRIDYTIKATNPELFSVTFVMAMSHLLASELAIPIVGAKEGRELRSDSLSIYQSYLSSAMTKDLNEDYEDVPESEYVTVRR
jgi:hypothetical protein